METDKYGNKLATYSLTMPCTLVGTKGPECPAGWVPVGYTQPGTCSLGNAPGDGTMDAWKMIGYNRVCKRKVPTSGDMGADCCSNLFGIANSVECKARAYNPYSWECNNIMQKRCNTNVQKDLYGPEWNGMPYGQNYTVFNGCTGQVRGPQTPQQPGCVDEFCTNYLRNAPPNNFYHDHDYQDYPHHFPRHSYATPDTAGTYGYKPMRTPYKPYDDWNHKNANNYCLQNPQQCWNMFINSYHF